eukprot:Amastigsp_a344428_8.p3 type:complete len:130 gc:universal Amastigsp_a344428_8:512-123(-)
MFACSHGSSTASSRGQRNSVGSPRSAWFIVTMSTFELIVSSSANGNAPEPGCGDTTVVLHSPAAEQRESTGIRWRALVVTMMYGNSVASGETRIGVRHDSKPKAKGDAVYAMFVPALCSSPCLDASNES